jgi:hypothetical protein
MKQFVDVLGGSAFRLTLGVAAVIASIGCSAKNDGQPDYRFTTAADPAPGLDADEAGAKASVKTAGWQKFVDDPKSAALTRDQNLQITLETGFVAGFNEFFSVRGEIGVIINVKEFGIDANIDFTQAGQRSGRLVYYSDDVRKNAGATGDGSPRPGNFLNFSSMPVYGPIKYAGRPVLIEVSVIEFDEYEVNRAKAVLQKLAQLGSVVYPPASPAPAVLNDIGSAFLTGVQDDSELRFHTVMYPFHGKDASTHNFLREGDLVLIKEENVRMVGGLPGAQGPIPWDELKLDPNTKRLVYNNDTKREFRSQSYFVFNISGKSQINDLNAQNEGQRLSTLYSQLSSSDDDMVGSKVESAVESLLSAANTRREFNSTRDAVDRVASQEFGTFGETSTLTGIVTPLQRELNPSETNKRVWTDAQVRRAMDDLRAALNTAGLKDQAAKVTDDFFKGKDVQTIVNQLMKPTP